MKVLIVSITLCMILTLSCAMPLNSTLCQDRRQNCINSTRPHDGYCPKCDNEGNFLPQQCARSNGYCWCVNVTSGLQIPNTVKPLESLLDCGKEWKTQISTTQPATTCVNCGTEWQTEISTTQPTTTCVNCDGDSHDCPDGWSSFGKRCFIFIDSPKSWVDAEVYCQFDKANLASVHSPTENHFIMSLTGGNTKNFPQTWLGGFDAIEPGYWMWSDGSDFNYRNWFDDRPKHDDDSDDDNEDNEHNNHDVNHDEAVTNDPNDVDHDNHDHETHDIYDVDGNKNCLKMNYEDGLQWFYASCRASLPFVCVKNIRPEQFN
ncbi:aggrecan core protein-like isoform X2 [Channa argus]|uniref:aggrecan core protein-like isoform X2 n=1 Tax=Channa argus TaxID=215402 RepID=UPI00352270DA